ncbi:cell wall / vacuolar inhibitor of fructosidase 2-like [Iris pallida]|uniref:Cell wall / vacuolar inhibitor of fructosidase 2-like n=1 Tax=Iris pallida TaxID=29817 RepID=A0AAX6E351_IRIPA|nr:cell wall / vacuolar inhibitor of fructosidase 2-like [Iris pallida]
MAPISFFTVFFFFLLPFLSFSLPLETSNLLIQTCNATTYYDFCVASLSSSPRASTAADATALTGIAIDLGIANATNTSSFASSLSKAARSPSLASLLAACADKYARAAEALGSSRDALKEGNYDYASVHASSAAEYPDVCRVLFQRSKGQAAAAYPAELARREDALKRLCAVALDIISLLS